MTRVWIAVLVVATMNAMIKALGPIVLGARAVPARVSTVLALLPVVLFTALVVVDSVTEGRELIVDARLAGLAAAAIALALRASTVLVVIVAVGATAAVRQLSG